MCYLRKVEWRIYKNDIFLYKCSIILKITHFLTFEKKADFNPEVICLLEPLKIVLNDNFSNLS